MSQIVTTRTCPRCDGAPEEVVATCDVCKGCGRIEIDDADRGARRVRVVRWEGDQMIVEREAWVGRDGAMALCNVRPGVSIHIDRPLA